jgi:serine/threonine protein kinase
MRYSKGIMWLDDCRIPFVENDGYTDEEWKNLYAGNRTDSSTNVGNEVKNIIRELLPKAPKGRFTPNLLVCDDMLNDGSVSKGNKPAKRNKNHRYSMDYGLKVFDGMDIIGYADTGSSSRFYDLDLWFDKMIESL